MLGFPLPYEGELIYSTIARHGIHSGITSPKALLREVFGNTKIIATTDLHSHLSQVNGLYPTECGVTPQSLLYKHTLFPLYAWFNDENRRRKLAIQLMSDAKSTVHLSSGFAASRVRQPAFLRYCPMCIEEQVAQHGECYWHREWQVAGVDCCPKHGELQTTVVPRTSKMRHMYWPASREVCPAHQQVTGSWQSLTLQPSIHQLLNMAESKAPSIEQWGGYYKSLACDFGMNKGQHVSHEQVADRVTNFWSQNWLGNHGLAISDSEYCWLRAIFRKHRKAFSYLEHLAVLHAFLGPQLSVQEVLTTVSKARVPKRMFKSLVTPTASELVIVKREKWLKGLKRLGTKGARKFGLAAIYAWLYRNDRDWLLTVNRIYLRRKTHNQSRVDWRQRDLKTVKHFFRIMNGAERELTGPRRSTVWYLNQLSNKSTVEKNLNKLPFCKRFLAVYPESVWQSQVRRITAAVASLVNAGEDVKRWVVLRQAGLSEERLTPQAKYLLEEIIGH